MSIWNDFLKWTKHVPPPKRTFILPGTGKDSDYSYSRNRRTSLPTERLSLFEGTIDEWKSHQERIEGFRRNYYRIVDDSISQAYHGKWLHGLASYELDVPYMQQEGTFILARATTYVERNEVYVHVLRQEPYAGEPLCPRLSHHHSSEPIELKKALRQDITKKIFEWKKVPPPFPLSEREILVLSYYSYSKRYNSKELSKELKIPQSTIQNYHKSITDLSKKLFDVEFKEGASTASHYWREMGLLVYK